MNIKKPILTGLATSVLVTIGTVLSVFAASVQLGQEGNTITIDKEVSKVSCSTIGTASTSPTSNGMKCDIAYQSGGSDTIYYTVQWRDDGHSAEWQQDAIEQKLIAGGLMSASNATGNGSSSGGTDTDAEGGGTDETADPVEERCTSILPSSWCTEDGDGIAGILNLVLNIMTAGMGILATIGLVISGIQWLTARDKEDQVVKAKSRIFNIVIGIMVWGIMWLVLQWLLPGGINLEIGAIV